MKKEVETQSEPPLQTDMPIEKYTHKQTGKTKREKASQDEKAQGPWQLFTMCHAVHHSQIFPVWSCFVFQTLLKNVVTPRQTGPKFGAFQHTFIDSLLYTVVVPAWLQRFSRQPNTQTTTTTTTHSGPSTIYAGQCDEPLQFRCVGFSWSHATTMPATKNSCGLFRCRPFET